LVSSLSPSPLPSEASRIDFNIMAVNRPSNWRAASRSACGSCRAAEARNRSRPWKSA
jgi:hypothetical protein